MVNLLNILRCVDVTDRNGTDQNRERENYRSLTFRYRGSSKWELNDQPK